MFDTDNLLKAPDYKLRMVHPAPDAPDLTLYARESLRMCRNGPDAPDYSAEGLMDIVVGDRMVTMDNGWRYDRVTSHCWPPRTCIVPDDPEPVDRERCKYFQHIDAGPRLCVVFGAPKPCACLGYDNCWSYQHLYHPVDRGDGGRGSG